MRNLKEQLGKVFGMKIGGSSAGVAKRRAVKPGSEEWKNMERPGSLVKVLGYISLSPGLLKRCSSYPITISSDSATERGCKI